MPDTIYTPLIVVQANQTRKDGEYQTCTKMDFRGFEISIASDQSLCAGTHLDRTDIRVYKGNVDHTQDFIDAYNEQMKTEINTFTSPSHIYFIMGALI